MLVKKHKRAVAGLAETKEAYLALENSLDMAKTQVWKRQEQQAMKEWGKFLKIFKVKADKGEALWNTMQSIKLTQKYKAPTQAEIHLALTSKEKQTGLHDGALGWLASGISLEKAQYVIVFILCGVGDFDRKPALLETNFMQRFVNFQHIPVSANAHS